MSTTPETARTAEQARTYDAWQEAKRKGVHVHELAAAIAFVRACLPEPQASPASDSHRLATFSEAMEWAHRPSAPPPASEAERPTPPPTVPVPLELAREFKEWGRDMRGRGVARVPFDHIYDTLAAGVKEADRELQDALGKPGANVFELASDFSNRLAVVQGRAEAPPPVFSVDALVSELKNTSEGLSSPCNWRPTR